ncbi:hypothetical protein MUK42_09179 [Musa troglodytarum]|uniref:ditrans,polycis-polyprenyl diphosphate synthase [(2E,6E)-farnesyldiphosphate specific] n=1 Tax=Musa troglodytarum TaxID=320322 RepID=A0A9E7EC45_9LILI|nr:hypothetical protein MUK42_09179 [Musa troglodytarum]
MASRPLISSCSFMWTRLTVVLFVLLLLLYLVALSSRIFLLGGCKALLVEKKELVRADFVVGVVCYLQAMADDVTRVLNPPSLVRISENLICVSLLLFRSWQKLNASIIWKLMLVFCWYLMHLLVCLVHIMSSLKKWLVSYIISFGLLSKYQNLRLDMLNCLAVVVDSEEAKDTRKIKHLLCWLFTMDIKYITLYDMQGVLKKTLGNDLMSLTKTSMRSCSVDDVKTVGSVFQMEKMTVEILSVSDGKEGIAKAASFLCSKYMKVDSVSCNKSEPAFTESDVANALNAVGMHFHMVIAHLNLSFFSYMDQLDAYGFTEIHEIWCCSEGNIPVFKEAPKPRHIIILFALLRLLDQDTSVLPNALLHQINEEVYRAKMAFSTSHEQKIQRDFSNTLPASTVLLFDSAIQAKEVESRHGGNNHQAEAGQEGTRYALPTWVQNFPYRLHSFIHCSSAWPDWPSSAASAAAAIAADATYASA